jgi:hypothetical protein
MSSNASWRYFCGCRTANLTNSANSAPHIEGFCRTPRPSFPRAARSTNCKPPSPTVPVKSKSPGSGTPLSHLKPDSKAENRVAAEVNLTRRLTSLFSRRSRHTSKVSRLVTSAATTHSLALSKSAEKSLFATAPTNSKAAFTPQAPTPYVLPLSGGTERVNSLPASAGSVPVGRDHLDINDR